jgi:methionine-rich copper-binding protein CopC
MRSSNLPVMRISLALRASMLAIGLLLLMAAPALAEPTVLSTSPEAGSEMHEPPGDVNIEFSEPLQSPSGIKVIDECGTNVADGEARIVGSAMNELNVIVGDAPHSGTYTVEYVATGLTGTATGSFTFFVHGGTNCDGTMSGHHHGGGDTGSGHHHMGSGDDHSGHGGDHSGMDHGDMDHSASGHSGMDHSGMSHSDMTGMDHMGSNAHDHMDMKHGHMAGMHHHHPKNVDNSKNNQNPPQAGPIRAAIPQPTSTSVLVALALALGLGVLGGWILRLATPN